MTTPLLGLSEIAEGVANQTTQHNQALRQIEARLVRVLSMTTDVPGTAAEGDSYIVPASATGAWAGKDHQVASYIGGAWYFFAPFEGFHTRVNDADAEYVFKSGAWSASTVSGAVTSVNGKTGPAVTLSASDVSAVPSSALGAANGVAELGSDSKLLAAQLPDLAIIQFLGTVASQSAMLALTGQSGDWCIRSDDSKVYIITGSDPTQLSSWTALSYPASAIYAVFGPSGASHSSGLVPDPGSTAGSTRFLREDGTWDVPAGGGGSSATDLQSFTTSGTWTKPAGVKFVRVICIGAGGGGGGACGGAASTLRQPGGGGGGGSMTSIVLNAADLGATETVTVGAGGAGGTGGSSGAGGVGGTGGNSSFGNWLRAYGGGGGGGGNSSTYVAGGGGAGSMGAGGNGASGSTGTGGNPATTSTNGFAGQGVPGQSSGGLCTEYGGAAGAGAQSSFALGANGGSAIYGGAGGGAGCPIDSTNSAYGAGAGGSVGISATGAGGGAAGGSGSAGNPGAAGAAGNSGHGGGGGGGGAANLSGTGGAGGAGGAGGGGGGGGGGGTSVGGAGGAGGNGAVYIFSW